MAAPTNLLTRKLVLSLFPISWRSISYARVYIKVCWLIPNASNVQQGVNGTV